MGASQSIVSGHHHSHREGWQHRLKRDGKNEVRARCGICSRQAEIGEAVHRCRSCDFVVHDACYRLPKKINNLAHSVHPLTLGDRSRAPAGARTSCSICAVAFDAAAGPSYFVYGCTRCHGFYAHPRCCGLPPTVHNSALHEHTLTLLAPPPPPEPSRASGRHVRSSRRCVNAAGKCPNANRWQKNAAAWSYQCSTCNVELCLTCQMPGGGGPAPAVPLDEEPNYGCANNDVVRTVGAVAEEVATAVGKALHALFCATLFGAQAPSPTPLPPPASK